MTISAVALFGSHARDDAALNSDVDVLLITTERRVRHASMGNVSLYLYPWKQLLRDSCGGDLFTCHIVREARPLHDPDGMLPALREAFRFKQSYSLEIEKASDLGWYIIHNSQELPETLVVKRIAWCVRTILIARGAERRAPVFSASELAHLSGSQDVFRLISHKAEGSLAAGDLVLFAAFLREFGVHDPVPAGNADGYLARFKALGNRVALQTLRSGKADSYGS